MLAITWRPSPSTRGRRSKRPSRSTIRDTALVAGAALPMAMPRSAVFRARASFTPSPVMATTCPRDCSACTIAFFWSGLTRPNTSCSAITAASSPGSSGRVRPS